jgi:hypothetical protein
MTKRISRRDMLGHTVRGAVVLGLGERRAC